MSSAVWYILQTTGSEDHFTARQTGLFISLGALDFFCYLSVVHPSDFGFWGSLHCHLAGLLLSLAASGFFCCMVHPSDYGLWGSFRCHQAGLLNWLVLLLQISSAASYILHGTGSEDHFTASKSCCFSCQDLHLGNKALWLKNVSL